ncbi:MAG: N-acetylmuramoyl-L-alanine amidase [Verrucomicrobiales bacterium]|jgi:N-acetylmuramoyl-L-alanine amidase
MRTTFEQLGRVLLTTLGLALFGFCFYQLTFVTRVVTQEEREKLAEEKLENVVENQRIDLRPVIMVDAGHGGRDGGAVGGGVIEKNLALTMAKRVVVMLEKDGRFRVAMTRDDDTFVELEERARMANSLDVALFVSIHLNTGPAASAHGVETWFAWPKPVSVMLTEKSKFGLPSDQRFVDDRGELLAQSIQDAVCLATGARDRGVKNKGHMVTRMVGAPSVIVECGFLTNAEEAKRLVTPSYQERTARGVVAGVISYLEEAMADPMYGIQQPVKPEKERILSTSSL